MQVSAQIYKWVDSDGLTHFSQYPPPLAQANPDTEVSKVQSKSNRLTTKDGKPYCGDLRLPSNEDPIYLLGDVKIQESNWTTQLERKQEQLDERRRLQMSSGRSGSSSSSYQQYRDRIVASINDLKCGLSWARKKEIELQPEYDKFQSEYQAALDGFEQYENRCGPQPEISGYTTDPRALEWARCQRAGGVDEHNKRVRELKRLKSIASSLEDQ